MKKIMPVFLCFSLLFTLLAPSLHAAYTKAQIAEYWGKVCTEAKMDAEMETNGMLWMGAGCLLGLIGVIASYAITPAWPGERLIGKNTTYASQYAKCYMSKAKDVQSGNAWAGWGIWVVIYAATLLTFFLIY